MTQGSCIVVWVDKAFEGEAAEKKKNAHQLDILRFAASLEDAGTTVVRCTSTADAVAAFSEASREHSVSAVISNMRRSESSTAGLDLYAQLSPMLCPFVLFTTTKTETSGRSNFHVVSTVRELADLLRELSVVGES
ncbi:hypothetical protein DIPPA_51244 [Diplonema papillatum]|nr:hypothetical protein DIPPA_51244 [Diplonema papillatum]